MGGRALRKAAEQVGNMRWRLMAVLVISTVLAGCSGPMDKSLVTNATLDVYRASLDPVVAKMTEREKSAFNWATSDFDLAKLNAKYPGGSAKDIIRGEVQDVLSTYPARIKSLEQEAAKSAPLRNDLRRIEAITAQLHIEKNFFGLQPTIKAVIANHSRRPVSQMKWQASLFLDGATTPVAKTVLVSDYRRNGGMKPGDSFNSTFKVGFVGGDERWTTLEIRNATKTHVVLEPILDSILDFGDRPYLADDAAKEIGNLGAALKVAKTFSDI